MIPNGYNQINLQLSYDKIAFVNDQKILKVANVCSYSKEGDLC